MNLPGNIPPMPLTVSEKDFQRTVIDLAEKLHWMVTHFRPAPTGRSNGKWVTHIQGYPGFPDLVLARNGAILCVELKAHRGRTSPFQRQWARELGEHYRLWNPTAWNDGTIIRELRHYGRVPLAAVGSDDAKR